MEQNNKFSKLIPHLSIIGIILIICVFFNLTAFQGNYLNMHDTYTWLQGSKEARDFYEKTGETTGWTNSMFGGMPQVTTEFQSSGNWFNKISNAFTFYTHGLPYNPAVLFALAMINFYLLSVAFKWNRWIGLIGALAYAYAAYNPIIIVAGHVTKMLDIAYIPGLFAAIVFAYRGKYWIGAALGGVIMAFMVDAAHYQIIYYVGVAIVFLLIGLAIHMFKTGQFKQFIKASLFLLVGVILGVVVNNSRFYQTQISTKYTIRGGNKELVEDKKETGLDKEYAFAWSNGVGENLCILVPGLYGGSSGEKLDASSAYGEKLASLRVPYNQIEQMVARTPTYWGPQPMLSGPMYFGAIICFLFVLSLFVVKHPLKWWALGVSVFFIILSTGKNMGINDFLFDNFPMLNKFRAPSMALVVPSFLFVAMGMWGLKEVFYGAHTKEELLKKIKMSLYIVGGILVAILIYSQAGMSYRGLNDDSLASQFGQAGDEIISAIRQDRANMALKDTFRSLILVVLAGLVLLAYTKEKFTSTVGLIILVVLVGFDNLGVAHRYINEDKYLTQDTWHRQMAPRAVDKQILQDKDLGYRVFDITKSPFNDAFPSLFHHSIGGYHGAKLQIYQDLIENQLNKFNGSVLNMLNTKYFILLGNQQQPEVVQQNPNALGAAWFVNSIKEVISAKEEMNALNAPSLQNPMDTSVGNFDPLSYAIIRSDRMANVSKNIGKDSNAYIKLVSAMPNKLVYESNNTQDGYGVFSEIYYPNGWTATIDGKAVEIIRTNYVLRGLNIPAGKHTIEFKYEYPNIKTNETLAMTGSALLILLIFAAVYMEIRKNNIASI
jgi:hypothetical protein